MIIGPFTRLGQKLNKLSQDNHDNNRCADPESFVREGPNLITFF